MTFEEVIAEAKRLRPGAQTIVPLLPAWLNEMEAAVQCNMLRMPEPMFDYILPGDAEEPMIIPAPYDDMYVWGLVCRIDLALNETQAYENSSTKFNERQAAAQKWLIRHFDPKHHKVHVGRSETVLEPEEVLAVTIGNIPMAYNDITAAYVNLYGQGPSGAVQRSLNAFASPAQCVLSADGTGKSKMTFSLKAGEWCRGVLRCGYSVTDSSAVTMTSTNAVAYYIKENKVTITEVRQ